MSYKIRVTIDGRDYTLSSDQNDGYIEQVAEYVDAQITMVSEALHASAINAATMAAMNIADSYYQEKFSSENIRKQLKEALDDNARLKREISDLKMENFRLSQKK